MNNSTKCEVVLIDHPHIGLPAPTLCFAFATLSFLFWGSMLGFFGPDTSLLCGCVQLGVYGVYHICGQTLVKRGDEWDGNIFLIFASMFAGVGGLTNVATGICGYLGFPVSPTLTGLVWFLSGVLLFLLAPGVRKGPAAGFLFYLAGGAGLVIQGLCQLTLLPMGGFFEVAAWCFFAAGCLGILVCVSTMYSFVGTNIPTGKPLFK